MYVGDHTGDVAGAKVAGCYSVAVATGPISRELLAAEGADVVFDSLEPFSAWLGTHLQYLQADASERSIFRYSHMPCAERRAPGTGSDSTSTSAGAAQGASASAGAVVPFKCIRCPSAGKSAIAGLTYRLRDGRVLALHEATDMVDGLGGATWDGAVLLCDLLDRWLSPLSYSVKGVQGVQGVQAESEAGAEADQSATGGHVRVLDVGCGTGISGLVAAVASSRVRAALTDQESDLALQNLRTARVHAALAEALQGLASAKVGTEAGVAAGTRGAAATDCSGSSDGADSEAETDEDADIGADIGADTDADSSQKLSGSPSGAPVSVPVPVDQITIMDLPWGAVGFPQCEEYIASSGWETPHLIVGAEIAVLYKQQVLLCETIAQLAGPWTIILLSVDGPAVGPAGPASAKEAEAATEEEEEEEEEKKNQGGKQRSRRPLREGYVVQLDRDMSSRGYLVRSAPAHAVVWSKCLHLDGMDLPKGSTAATLMSSAEEVERQEETAIHHIRAYYRPELLDASNASHPLLQQPVIRSFFETD